MAKYIYVLSDFILKTVRSNRRKWKKMVSRSGISGQWSASDREAYRSAIDSSGAAKGLEGCVTKKPNGKGGVDISFDSSCYHNAMEKAAKELENAWTE